MYRILSIARLLLLLLLVPLATHATRFNAFGLKFFTAETEHFRIHYHKGLEHLVPRVGAQCEKLYSIYREQYGLALPTKTDFVVIDGDYSNGWAFANTNTITIWTHDFDFNLRGSHDWFEDVITHEYAHIVSIQSGLKLPPAIPEIRLGIFSHPNEKGRAEVFHSVASDILPHWFTEGIAQYSSSIHGTDSWDAHRDMILRSMTLSGKLNSWDHMQVFAGKGNDFEKTYNMGFAMVRYIVERYGEDKLTALLRESIKFTRMDFDGSMRAVFGVPARTFYRDWTQYLYIKYKRQLDTIGTQVYGKKLNKDGYENFWPRFSPDGRKVYFLSNGKNDYGFKILYTVRLDSVPEKDRIKPVGRIRGFYDFDPKSGRVCFTSSHSKKSRLPPDRGGDASSDLFTDTIPQDSMQFKFFPKKTEKQVTEKQSIFSAAFSPSGNRLACAKRSIDQFYLGIADTNGKTLQIVYPPKDSIALRIDFIYSIDWSPDGKKIVFSFFDRHDRKIGIYDTASHTCELICNTEGDERDPAFSPDGKHLYFSSDRTGIFNLYRYDFAQKRLQRITNVTGGAFAPSVSPNGRQVVYAGYDANGYGIYLLDSIRMVHDTTLSNAITSRIASPPAPRASVVGQSRPYSYLPRQFLLVPTLLTEQAVSTRDDVNQGVGTFKAGLIVNLLDPLTLSNLGNEIGGYLFLEPGRLFSFVNLDEKGISIAANYDLGMYGVTHMLPLTLSGEFQMRGIAGEDLFFNETEGIMDTLPYRIDLQNGTLQLSHFIQGDYENSSAPQNQLAVHLLTGFNRYDVNLQFVEDAKIFSYNLSKGYRAGAMATFSTSIKEPTRSIAPRGLVAKLQYDLWNQYSLKQENSFDSSTSMKERYDTYLFHQFTGHAKLGVGTPWSKRQMVHADVQASLLQVLRQDTTFASFYLPAAWVPGYAYYYRDATDPKHSIDSLLVTGRAVINGEVSYRFPLSPKLIDKKLGFLYFERIYGAGNINFGAGWDNPNDFFNFNRNDLLLACGIELRVEAISFNTYPFDIKLRWDYGADQRPAGRYGGNRFTFAVGYDFDNWGMVLMPDYRQNKLMTNRF